ncbi:uncharacterized protein LOC124156529 [Ischnura elegans]|uniref:uncharacterized protein LOC124156529 n=1 Tax=Ischnura elegans TaxID=197161 RepID=UPI001ED8AE68|nr:uncharacterized protein LOC124156529 [Ischnura elegans]
MKVLPKFRLMCVIVVTVVLLTTMAECGSRRKRRKKLAENKGETNIFDFVRLLTLRLIYGVASMMGFQEGISDFMGGILVPPGADYDYDYGGGDYGGGDDDY